MRVRGRVRERRAETGAGANAGKGVRCVARVGTGTAVSERANKARRALLRAGEGMRLCEWRRERVAKRDRTGVGSERTACEWLAAGCERLRARRRERRSQSLCAVPVPRPRVTGEEERASSCGFLGRRS